MLQSLVSFLYRWIDENNLPENESENAVRDELARKHGLYVADCSARHPIDWYTQNCQYTRGYSLRFYDACCIQLHIQVLTVIGTHRTARRSVLGFNAACLHDRCAIIRAILEIRKGLSKYIFFKACITKLFWEEVMLLYMHWSKENAVYGVDRVHGASSFIFIYLI
jgi:hypothetical protein